jgi:hypothetical protein
MRKRKRKRKSREKTTTENKIAQSTKETLCSFSYDREGIL